MKNVSTLSTRAKSFAVLFTFAICVCFAASNAEAATFTVMNTNAGGAGSLRDAIDQASANGQADTIDFDGTVFASHQIINSDDGYLIAADGKVTINGPAVGVTLSLANSPVSIRRVFGIFDPNAELEINNLTLTGGLTFQGGGIYSVGTVMIINSTIAGNSTSETGGGITNIGGTLVVRNSTVSGNSSQFGGGIFSSGTLTLENSTVSGNSATADAAGVYNANGHLSLDKSTVSGNSAILSGGGICSVNGTVTLDNTTVSGNSGTWGGGIINFYGPVTLNKSTVSGNLASSLGGGLYSDGGLLTVRNGTISSNSASVQGGGIYQIGQVISASSIWANNISPVDADFAGFVFTEGYNLFETAPSSGGNLLTDVIGDPMLGLLQDNGGPTKTHALLPGSPAIDHGSNLAPLATDQRGYLRTYDFAAVPDGSGGATDIGAFELDPDSDGDGVRDFSDNCGSTPNPEKIAFSSNRDVPTNSEIYVMDALGSNVTRLTNNAGQDQYPAFSPDGSKIAFISTRDGNLEVYVMNSDGTGQTNLTNDPGEDSYPAFSPDGSKIVFTSSRDGNHEVYVINADGTGLINLTNNPATDGIPGFSPDGSKIAFLSRRDGNAEVYVMNSNGTGQTNLTNNAADDLQPIFSPDGSKIAFYSFRDGNYEIYVMNSDGTGQTNLSNNPAEDDQPSFSPDGSKIVFHSVSAANHELYSMNSDGTNRVNLTNNFPVLDFQPSWGSQADSDGDGIGDACENTAPTISANSISRQQAAGSSNSSIATVGDGEDDLNDLIITVGNAGSATVNGVTVSNISVNAAGNVTADVSAACGASSAMFSLKVSDGGGLEATAILNVTVTNETTAPVIDPTSNVTVYLPLNSPASSMPVNFLLPTATDNCSTPVVTTSPVSGSVFSIGTTTVNITAKDALNNTSTATFTVTVLYNFGGFLQPVDPMPMLNIAQAGSSIPVKFSLSGNKGLGILAAGYPISALLPCDQNEPGNQVEETDSAGNSVLTYDAQSDQYKYVWKTNKLWKGTCRMLVAKLVDGTEHFAKFRFK